MNGIDGLAALRRANPRHKPGFIDAVNAVVRITEETHDTRANWSTARGRSWHSGPQFPWRRRILRAPVVAGLLTVLSTAALVAFGSAFGTSTASTAAAMQQAVKVSADGADASGTVSVQVTRDGSLWAATTVRWNGADISVTSDHPSRSSGGELRVVGGTMYAPDEGASGVWLELGSPDSIDPGTGTTPDDYLQAVREDASGATLRRLTEAMTDLTTRRTDDGRTVYTGRVPTGALAREPRVKEGRAIRILPYGYVAHDEAADPASRVAVRITIGADDTVQEIVAEWGGASDWTYRLAFRDLGSTQSPSVPDNVKSLERCRLAPPQSRPTC